MADDETMVPLEPSSGDTPPTFSGVTVVAEPQPIMVTPVAVDVEDLAPHSFRALAITVALFCGIAYLLSLICSIPAVVLSFMVGIKYHNKLFAIPV